MIVGEDAYLDIVKGKWREVMIIVTVYRRVMPCERVFILKYYNGRGSNYQIQTNKVIGFHFMSSILWVMLVVRKLGIHAMSCNSPIL